MAREIPDASEWNGLRQFLAVLFSVLSFFFTVDSGVKVKRETTLRVAVQYTVDTALRGLSGTPRVQFVYVINYYDDDCDFAIVFNANVTISPTELKESTTFRSSSNP